MTTSERIAGRGQRPFMQNVPANKSRYALKLQGRYRDGR